MFVCHVPVAREFRQGPGDRQMQPALDMPALSTKPFREGIAQVDLVEQSLVADTAELVTGAADPAFGQCRLKVTEIGLHALNVDCDLTVR